MAQSTAKKTNNAESEIPHESSTLYTPVHILMPASPLVSTYVCYLDLAH